MGTPSTALQHRTDNKLYRLQTGQTPVVRPALHNTYAMDSFPNGTNAVVAVISYTGYDMEDAMILNKSAHERGFGYGTIYKSQIVDLKEVPGAQRFSSTPSLHFGISPDIKMDGNTPHPCSQTVDRDGLPFLGVRLKSGDILAAYVDDTVGRTRFVKYKGDETAYVDQVRLLGNTVLSYLLYALLRVHLQVAMPGTLSSKKFKSLSEYRDLRSLGINSHPVMGKRVSARKNGLPLICLSVKAGFNQTLSSTPTRSQVV